HMRCRTFLLHSALWVVGTGQLLGCNLFDKDKDKPKQQEPAVPLATLELCAMYLSQDLNYFRFQSDDIDTVLCAVMPTHTALELSAAEVEYQCRPGTNGRIWADGLLAAEAAGRVDIDWRMARE